MLARRNKMGFSKVTICFYVCSMVTTLLRLAYDSLTTSLRLAYDSLTTRLRLAYDSLTTLLRLAYDSLTPNDLINYCFISMAAHASLAYTFAYVLLKVCLVQITAYIRGAALQLKKEKGELRTG